VLEVEKDENRQWIPNRARFYVNRLNIVLQEKMEFSTSIGRTDLERLLHLWSFDDEEMRDGWNNKKYWILYQALVKSWNSYFGTHTGWIWRWPAVYQCLQLPPKPFQHFDDTMIAENAILRTPNEQAAYDRTWNMPCLASYMLMDIRISFYRTKGYFSARESNYDYRQRTADIFHQDKHAFHIMKLLVPKTQLKQVLDDVNKLEMLPFQGN